MKLRYINIILHVAQFYINDVLLTRNSCEEANVPKIRGALRTGFTTAPVLEAGGKPSTWFPPEGLVELTCHARGMPMPSNHFLMKKWKFSKISKNLIFLEFYENLSVTQTLCLQTQIDKR